MLLERPAADHGPARMAPAQVLSPQGRLQPAVRSRPCEPPAPAGSPARPSELPAISGAGPESCVEELGRARPSPCIEAEAGRSSRGPVRTTHTPEGPDDETDPTQDHPRRRRAGCGRPGVRWRADEGLGRAARHRRPDRPGGMGTNHLRLLAARKDVEVAYVCDVDRNRLAEAASGRRERRGQGPQGGQGPAPACSTTTASTPSGSRRPTTGTRPAAILALRRRQARLRREALLPQHPRRPADGRGGQARPASVVQVGTQSRSTAVVREAIAARPRRARSARSWSPRPGTASCAAIIGKTKPSEPPAHLDFDLWLGPAPLVPYRSNLLPGIWRWWYDFGCGDIGNDGVHDIDVACWGLGVDDPPVDRSPASAASTSSTTTSSSPTRSTPSSSTPTTASRAAAKQLIFEQRIWSPYVQEGYENGAAFYGTKGMLIIGHTVGWKLYGPRNKLIAERTGAADLPAHHHELPRLHPRRRRSSSTPT